MLSLAPQLLRQLNRTVRQRLSSTKNQALTFVPKPRSPSLQARPEAQPEIQKTLERATKHLSLLQRAEGFWEGRVYDNVTITSEYVMFLKFLGQLDEATASKTRETILNSQCEEGAWNIYAGGPSDHSANVEAYFALKLCGLTRRHKVMQRARERIIEAGGIDTTRVFTKIHLALFGQFPWDRIPVINPELMLLPKAAPIHLYEFSSWSRAVIVPLLMIFDKKPVVELPATQHVQELYRDGKPNSSYRKPIRELLKDRRWNLEQIFEVAQTALSLYEKMPVKPLRQRALAMAEKWVLDHHDAKGNWGGIYPAMANSILAFHLRGYDLKHPIMEKGLRMLRSFIEETPQTLRMQSTVSPVWDTGIAAYAMQEAGVSSQDPHIQKCVDWLLKLQILDVYGDWRFKALSGTRPGGWPFEHENDHYPDIDDTALAILALLPSEHSPTFRPELMHAVDRGIEWLLGMQSSDGGWGAFDRDNNRQMLNQIPFADLKSLLDPSSPDVTGHVIEALGAAGYDRTFEPIERAVQYLQDSQEDNGSWFGRWGVNYVYGTSATLSGVWIAGEEMNKPYIQKAKAWLLSVQNSDGGWGESCSSYDEGKYVPLGYSTASQTAWGLIGLLSGGDGDEKAIQRGVKWLMDHQNSEGGWDEPEWTGTGFPRHFYLRYDYYRHYFPVLALARYSTRKSRRKRAPQVGRA